MPGRADTGKTRRGTPNDLAFKVDTETFELRVTLSKLVGISQPAKVATRGQSLHIASPKETIDSGRR